MVNLAPDAVDDAYTIHASQVFLFVPAPGFLGNDSDADGDAFFLISVDATGVPGSLSVFLDGRIGFIPEAGFVGATSFTYSIGDEAGGVDTANVTINVVNNLILANAISDQSATEDAPFSFTVPGTTFAGEGVGEGLILSATLANGNPLPAWLSFDSATGEFAGTPLNGDVGPITVRVTATNAVLESASGEFVLAVANTNDDPIIAGDANVSLTIPENTTFVTTIAASDPDGDVLTYELAGLDADKFTIDAVTHEIRFKSPPNFENTTGPFDFLLGVTDGNGGIAIQTFQVTLSDLNEAPSGVVIAAQGAHVVPAGYVISDPVRIGRVVIHDDQLGTNLISLSGADADKFSLVTENGDTFLTLLPGATAALATPNTINVTVNIDDPALGGPVDASTTYALTSAAPGEEDFFPLLSGHSQISRVVTYSFEDGRPSPSGQFNGFGGIFTSDDKLAAGEALASWGDGSGLIFIEVPIGQGDIRFYIHDLAGSETGVSSFPPGSTTHITIDPVARTDFYTWSHEIGHALGLFHSFPEPFGAPGVDPLFDTSDFTVMSYTQGFQPATSIGLLDQDAAQFLYGGPDLGTYTFNPATLDFVYTGSESADEIYGNRRFTNVLDGVGGDDTLNAIGLNNRLTGGGGNDDLKTLASSARYTAVYSGLFTDYTFEFVGGMPGGDPPFVRIADTRDQTPDGIDRVFDNDPFFRNVSFEFAGEQASFGEIFDIHPTDIVFTVNGIDPVAGFSIAEDAAPGTAFGSISQIVMSAGFMNLPTPSLSLVDGPPGFALQGNELVVFGALDFETVQFYEIVVRAVDLYGGIYEETVHIDITDVELTIFGTPDNDDDATNPAIFGTFEEDTIFGLGGDDFIVQSPGSDDIDGGEGNDGFVLLLGFDDYTIAENPDGSISFSYEAFVLGPSAGTDTVRAVELFLDMNGVVKTLSDFVNDAPVAEPDAGSAGENETKNFVVLDNDTDPDAGDSKTLVSIGAVSVSSSNPLIDGLIAASAFSISGDQIQFSPGTLFDPLDSGETAAVTVNYTMRDGAGLTSSSVLTLTIDGATDAPVFNVINGTPGNDPNLNGTAAADQINGFAGDDDIEARGGNDLIFADAGGDTVSAGSGNDTIVATINDGNDDYGGGIGVDTVDYSATTVALTITLGQGAQSTETGTDTLTSIENAIGGGGNDLISGNRYANVLDGGVGNDTLLGYAGNDILIGGLGNDVMSGGAGQDEFAFGPGSGNDRIVGFDADPVNGQDRLDISALGITGASFFSRVTIDDVGADTLVTIDGLANQTIRLVGVSNAMTVTLDDFILL